MAHNTIQNKSLTTLLQHGFRYAMSLTHDVAKAEDILQDAWLAVLKASGPHEKGYLFSAIRTRFINQYRRELLVPIVSFDDEIIGGVDQVAGTADVSLAKFHIDDLEKQLAILRPLEREAIYLSAVEGFSAREISDQTRQPRGTVLSLIYRAKRKLRESFNNEIREANQ